MGGLRAFAAELSGTFLLTLAAAGALCMEAASGGRMGPAAPAFAYGAATLVAFYAFPGEGARFNPALTLAEVVVKRLGPLQGLFAVAAQLMGATCAGLLLRSVLIAGKPDLLLSPAYLGACYPIGVGYRAATLIEAVLTFFLSCALAAGGDRRRRKLAPLAAGAAVLAGGVAFGGLTGGAMNPARAFGSAIAAGFWSAHYVYWVGPVAGAVLAALVAPYLIQEENRP